jgi:hypothetical protein
MALSGLCWSVVATAFAMNQPIPELPSDFSQEQFQALLRPGHPRLFATGERWEAIREASKTDPHLKAAMVAFTEVADSLRDLPPEERVMTGRRLLSVSREVLRRTLVLGVVYQVTGEERHFERARDELLAAAAVEDWNPSHFLDTAEMTLALAVGYDWFYEKFSAEEQAALREAIVEKGLKPGTGSHRWKERDSNWNQVCFAGMVAGALAVGDHEPALAATFLSEMFANIHRPLEAYRPHGAYPEGPVYWSYGTSFQVILLSVLESALGKTWNLENYPAFQESAVYINLMIGPSGEFFNYADCRARVPPIPVLHWFAAQARNPALDARERQRLLSYPVALPALQARAHEGYLFPLAIVWFDPSLEKSNAQPLPLHWRADGPNPVAVHRSSRADDAFFAAIKGGSPSVNHGHMDIGSFVLDWRGLRWGMDLGVQEYESLESAGVRIWNRGQEADRWRVFRMNTMSHNTLVFDDRQQLVDGYAPIVAFSDDSAAPFTVVDMTDVYRDSVEQALRGMRILDEQILLIADAIAGLSSGQQVRWGMVTPAEVELQGNRALLRQAGETLHARILSPAGAAFSIVQTDPPPSDFDASNPGTRMLAFFADGSGEFQNLQVVFSKERLSDAHAVEIGSLPPVDQW